MESKLAKDSQIISLVAQGFQSNLGNHEWNPLAKGRPLLSSLAPFLLLLLSSRGASYLAQAGRHNLY